MYVCICNAVTERQIRDAASGGVNDLWSLQRELGVAAGCGSCMETASAILNEVQGAAVAPQPVVYRPALA